MKRTSIFIGGKNAILALDMLEEARHAMVPPFVVSVFADPQARSTAAAMVACVEKTLKTKLDTTLAKRRIAVFGATGVVGFSAAVISAQEGAQVTLVGYDGTKRVKDLAANAKARFDVEIGFADGSSDKLKADAIRDAEIVLCAAAAGVQVLSTAQLNGAPGARRSRRQRRATRGCRGTRGAGERRCAPRHERRRHRRARDRQHQVQGGIGPVQEDDRGAEGVVPRLP